MGSVRMGKHWEIVGDVTNLLEKLGLKTLRVTNLGSLPQAVSFSYQFQAGLLKQHPRRHRVVTETFAIHTHTFQVRSTVGSLETKASKIIFPLVHVDLTMTREAEKFHLY